MYLILVNFNHTAYHNSTILWVWTWGWEQGNCKVWRLFQTICIWGLLSSWMLNLGTIYQSHVRGSSLTFERWDWQIVPKFRKRTTNLSSVTAKNTEGPNNTATQACSVTHPHVSNVFSKVTINKRVCDDKTGRRLQPQNSVSKLLRVSSDSIMLM